MAVMFAMRRSNNSGFMMMRKGRLSRRMIEKIGGASRARTDDLIVANDALSQLSYSPTCGKVLKLILTSALELLLHDPDQHAIAVLLQEEHGVGVDHVVVDGGLGEVASGLHDSTL